MKKKAAGFFAIILLCTQAAYGMGKKEVQKFETNLTNTSMDFAAEIGKPFDPGSLAEVQSCLKKGNLVLQAFEKLRSALLEEPPDTKKLKAILEMQDIHQATMNKLVLQMGRLEGESWCSIL